MIFYTLQGPGYELEIHDDKLRIIRKSWFSFLGKNSSSLTWEIKDLSQFNITVPKFFMISGKIEWQTFKGEKGHFRFSTNPLMVKKIEAYIQKKVIKNHQQLHSIKPLPAPKKNRERRIAA
ncbi:MAG: hypothetical protein ACLGHN_13345 [Bacteriovoracia bacterium]